MERISLLFFAIIGSVTLAFSQSVLFHYDSGGNLISQTVRGTVSSATIQGPETACAGDSLLLTAIGGDTYQWSNGSFGNKITVAPETSSTYRVTVTDENGCSAVSSHLIEVLPKPEPFEIEGDLTGFSGSTPNEYTINPVAQNSSYYWSIEGGYILSGYGSPEVEVIWQTDSVGLIKVVEQNKAGCFGDTVIQRIVIASRQVIPLHAGWNLISTYLNVGNSSPQSVFGALGDNLIKVKNIEEVYDPSAPSVFNTLEEILPGNGYWVKVKNDIELSLFGHSVDPLNTPISLVSGWNLIGYTWSEPQPVEHAFAEITLQLEKVKDIFSSYDPDQAPIFNTLKTVGPGKGYWVNVAQGTIFNFPVPDEARMTPEMHQEALVEQEWKANLNTDWKAIAYPNSTIAYGRVTLDGESVEKGAVIGAFVNQECRALAKVFNQSDTSYVSFVINGEIEEPIEFRMIYQGRSYLSDLFIYTQPGIPFDYLLPIHFNTDSPTYIEEPDEDKIRVSAFPNPFSETVTLEIFLKSPSRVEIRILDWKGRTLDILKKGLLSTGNHNFHWAPHQGKLAEGVYLVQLKGVNFNVLKKIVYQK